MNDINVIRREFPNHIPLIVSLKSQHLSVKNNKQLHHSNQSLKSCYEKIANLISGDKSCSLIFKINGMELDETLSLVYVYEKYKENDLLRISVYRNSWNYLINNLVCNYARFLN